VRAVHSFQNIASARSSIDLKSASSTTDENDVARFRRTSPIFGDQGGSALFKEVRPAWWPNDYVRLPTSRPTSACPVSARPPTGTIAHARPLRAPVLTTERMRNASRGRCWARRSGNQNASFSCFLLSRAPVPATAYSRRPPPLVWRSLSEHSSGLRLNRARGGPRAGLLGCWLWGGSLPRRPAVLISAPSVSPASVDPRPSTAGAHLPSPVFPLRGDLHTSGTFELASCCESRT